MSAESLEEALLNCFENPGQILGSNIELSNPDRYGVWLFDYLMVVIKAHSQNQQGYGYTKLGRESGFRQVAATPGFIISPFIQRRKQMRNDILRGISEALSRRISSIGHSWIMNSNQQISEYYLRGLFEDKIYKISAFDPLKSLIVSLLERQEIQYQEIDEHSTGLTDLIGGRYATCSILSVNRTIIFWQSVSSGHGNDKSKELMGRVGMLRVVGDVDNFDFYIRQGIEKGSSDLDMGKRL